MLSHSGLKCIIQALAVSVVLCAGDFVGGL